MGALVQQRQQNLHHTANQTLADWAGEEIVDVSVAALGEGVGLMSSIARAELTLASGARRWDRQSHRANRKWAYRRAQLLQ